MLINKLYTKWLFEDKVKVIFNSLCSNICLNKYNIYGRMKFSNNYLLHYQCVLHSFIFSVKLFKVNTIF